MDEAAVYRLVDLNHQFYQTFAGEFAATRQRLQPGVTGLLGRLARQTSLLDVGCGSGELARWLALHGFEGEYTGLDFSEKLLAHARQRVQGEGSESGNKGRYSFLKADLARPGWDTPLGGLQWDAALSFAVLHHLPGEDLRLRMLRTIRNRLKPGGRFFFSVWQFRSSEKLTARIVPWGEIGLEAGQVDAGDALLDWRAGGRGLRYVHEFDELELERLAGASGFKVEETFYSDGKQGNLALYQVWQPADIDGSASTQR